MSQEILLKIEALTSEGEGIGTHKGLKIFVPEALPGEEILVTLTEKKKNYGKGSLLKILSSSSDRIEPPCPHFKECGGCQLMHLTYPGQLAYKRQKVQDAFDRIAKQAVTVEACLPSPHLLSYRNKVQLPLIWKQGSKEIGFFKKNSHEIIPIDNCLIQSKLGNAILHSCKETLELSSVRYLLIKTSFDQKQALITFVTTGDQKKDLIAYSHTLMKIHPEIVGVVENLNQREDSVILTQEERLLAGQNYFTETLLNHQFKVGSTTFFQVNPKQAEELFAKALALAAIKPDHILVDAYCGVGTLAILAASHAKKVFGIEISEKSISQAKENAKLNKVDNCIFYAAAAEKKLKELSEIDTLFINPPRKGCDPTFLALLSEIKPKTLIYISCNPATLARDITLLPDYQINTIIPFDMFPQTTHVETLVKLIIK